MKRVMIDLETLAISKDAAIMSIGAAVFDLHAETVLDEWVQNVDVMSCAEYGLVTDSSTMEFWRRPENAEAFGEMGKDAVHLRDALEMLRAWLLRNVDKEDVEPWANGTSFDLAILEVAFNRVRLPLPWKFYNERDYRTMKCMYRDVAKPEFKGTKHNALDDARFQAEHLLRIIKAKSLCL